MSLQGLETEIFGAIVIGLAAWTYRRWWRIIKEPIPRYAGPLSVEPGFDDPSLTVSLPGGLSVTEKVELLETLLEQPESPRAQRADIHGAESEDERRAMIEATLAGMTFLRPGDVLEDSFQMDHRFELVERLGQGRTSVVWKARDPRANRFVAVKILRHPFNRDRSAVEQFRNSAHLMTLCSDSSIASIRQEVHELPETGRLKIAYYVLDYVDGDPLDVYVRSNAFDVERNVDELLALGQCVTNLHAVGVLHRDIKPSNIIVQPGGTMKLVDFDEAVKVGAAQAQARSFGTVGYAAPEVLENWPDQDGRADVFAMARVISHAYYGEALPNAYGMSVPDQVDLLNCTPHVKRALGRASAVRREDRHGTMQEFIEEMKSAVKETKVPLMATLRHERSKIYRNVRDAVYGTTLIILATRPLLVSWPIVQLSDTPWVAAFHSAIGGLAWGAFISFAFLLYLILLRREGAPGYILSMLCCGIGGFLGGVLVSIPAVIVTNSDTLTCLGWLREPVDGWPRFAVALLDTKMMWAYPLTGLFNGLGLGLALNRGITLALRASPQGTGVLPVPSKRRGTSRRDNLRYLRPLLLSWKSHLFLAFPIIFAFAFGHLLNASTPPVGLGCKFVLVPNAYWRCVGEGVVHYTGAIGLMLAFFYGIPTETTPGNP